MLVLINVCNCTHISHVCLLNFHLRVVKTREPKDEQLCIAVHIVNNIHDTEPLDN